MIFRITYTQTATQHTRTGTVIRHVFIEIVLHDKTKAEETARQLQLEGKNVRLIKGICA